ncbi:MAG TPA: hypothetical protein DCG75_05495 [Bacteroidales bacterium]|nr:hypothetical protein [Bacteroidales bacterium]
MRKNYQTKPKAPISTDQLFTGAKTPEYAVFYNIAYWWMSEMLKRLYKNTDTSIHEDTSPFIQRFVNDGEEINSSIFSDADYIKLRDYLWKGYLFDKNKSGSIITFKDKVIIHKIIAKLAEIRNFHSHYWHDNSILKCDEDLKSWIDFLHNYAVDKLRVEYSKEIERYESNRDNLFDMHGSDYFITQEGRNFFLSFFLKKSEMSRFMQQRKGCKRNDKPEFMIKHQVYRYYTHRDGASRNRYSIEETVFSALDPDSKSEINKARQVYKMLAYLNDIPSEVIDKKLFPLLLNDEIVEDSTQIIKFIKKHNLFSNCKFGIIEDSKGEVIQKEVLFSYVDSKYNFRIRIAALHKLILDIIRNSKREEEFYNTLKTFGDFRDQFPIILDDIKKGIGNIEELNEYYIFKLKADDKTRGLLGKVIDDYNKNQFIKLKDYNELKEKSVDEPIQLIYHNFYFESGQKPRSGNQFMEFAVKYLMDKNLVPNWEWLLEKYESEEVEKKLENNNPKKVVKHIKAYFSYIPDGYRLHFKEDHVLLRLKYESEIIIEVGENAMKNLLITHFHGKPINEVVEKTVSDINKIKHVAKNNKTLTEKLELLNDKTIPRYLKLMMHDESVMQNETINYSIIQAKNRIDRLIEYFEDLHSDKVKLNRREINIQLIRCYKYFDWNYPNNSEYKFLRQNEYQLMSIYHYTLAKPKNAKHHLLILRKELFGDINKHLPTNLKLILEEATSIDELFKTVLLETISRLNKWKNRFSSMNSNQKKDCLSKLGIHIPKIPVPDASNKANLGQMKNLPFMLHPSLVFMTFKYSRSSTIFSEYRDNPKNSKGLLMDHYNFQSYLDLHSVLIDQKQAHKIVGTINNLKTLDTLIWQMTKKYLDDTTSDILKNITNELINSSTENFNVNQLHNFEFPIFKSDKSEVKPFKVIVKFKQLADFMLITEKPLKNVALQLFKRYQTNEELEKLEVYFKNGFYEIPYVQIKQEMDRIYRESLILADFILDWEKSIVDKIPEIEKQKLIESAKQNTNGYKAYINFDTVCNYAGLIKEEQSELQNLRNHALHAKIPDKDWTYKQKLNDNRIQKMLYITLEKLEKYEKKNAYYESKVLHNTY